jgi:serine/threonine protein kinase
MPKIPAATAAPLVPGYRDFAPIARSDSSEVYRAYQEGVDRPVAIKVLLLDDEEAALRFEREVDITVQLGRQHPNIVTVLDVRTTSTGRPCIVMEYYDRGSLHDRLRERGPLPAGEVLAAGIAVADALAFAHVHGVLHRDIKPQNVLVLPTTYVLADFGIARRVDAGHTSSVEWFSFRHAAPQVLDGEPPAVEDDIWSVGSTLFTLLDGSAPFAPPGSEDSALAYMRRVRQGEVRTLRRADVQPGLIDIVMRCLRPDRAERFADAASLQDALAGLAADTRGWAPPGDRSGPGVPSADPSGPGVPSADRSGPGVPSAAEASTAARAGPKSPNTMARVVASAVSAGGYEAPSAPAVDPSVEEPLRESGRLRRFLPRIVVALVVGGLVGVAGTFVIASANRAGSLPPSAAVSAGPLSGGSDGASVPGSGASRGAGASAGSGGSTGSGSPGSSGAADSSASPNGPDVNDPRIAPVITQLEARGAEGVFLRWQDRSGGAAAFVVVQVGSRGDPLKTVSPGVTQAAIGGLDPATAPYCFHVIAIVGADQRGVSPQRCLGTP